MNFKEKIKTSYLYSFIFQTLLMFVLSILVTKLNKSEIDYLQISLSSVVYGIIMSWFFINAMNRKKKQDGE